MVTRLACAILLLMMTGCAGYTPPAATPDLYPDSYSTREVGLDWRVERKADSIGVTGVARNRFFYPLLDFDLTARLLDSSGKSIGPDAFYGFPGQISPNQREEFSFAFPLKQGDVPAKIRFTTRYRVQEDRHTDLPSSHTFERDVR